MNRSVVWLIGAALLISSAPRAQSAGAYGHFVIAKRVVDGINNGSRDAPPELKEVLADPECVKAFCGGAVAPDICEKNSHYGSTGDLVRAMGAKAMSDLETAKKSGDPAALKRARTNVAFCYGWLSHCAADLNIHPLVNGMAGDSYAYCTVGQKAVHAAQEVQLDAYLYRNFKKPGEKYVVNIPFDFLSSFVGESPDSLKKNMKTLNAKVMGELLWKEKCTLSNEVLEKKWLNTVRNCVGDTVKLVNNPNLLQNWDLDTGPISTEDFKNLRKAVMQANGGKLPKGWGGNYLDIYHKLRGDTPPDQTADSGKPSKPAEGGAGQVDFKLPPPPRVHPKLTDLDCDQIGQWRDKCIAALEKQMEEDPLRVANKEECLKIPRTDRELTCAKCGWAGVHWWIEGSWSCQRCEFCTFPINLKRADGKTYTEFADERKKIYLDKMEEIRKQAEQMLKKK